MLELTAAVLAVVFQSQVKEWINEFYMANIKAYRDDIDLQNLIDSLQRMVMNPPPGAPPVGPARVFELLTLFVLCVVVVVCLTELLLRGTRPLGLEHQRLLQLRRRQPQQREVWRPVLLLRQRPCCEPITHADPSRLVNTQQTDCKLSNTQKMGLSFRTLW